MGAGADGYAAPFPLAESPRGADELVSLIQDKVVFSASLVVNTTPVD